MNYPAAIVAAAANWRGYVLVGGAPFMFFHFNATRWGISCDGEEIARVWPLGIGTGDPAQIAWATNIPSIIASTCTGYPMYLSIFATGDRMSTLIVGVILPAVWLLTVAVFAISYLVRRHSSAKARARSRNSGR